MATKTKKLNWIEQVMLKIEGSDKSKVELTYDRAVRELEKRKRNKLAEIEKKKLELTDKLVDEKEKLTDYIEEYEASITTIDVKRIQTTDDRNNYVNNTLFENILRKKNGVITQEQKIKDIEKSYANAIEELEENIKFIDELIEKF
jgi:hypothetical protein